MKTESERESCSLPDMLALWKWENWSKEAETPEQIATPNFSSGQKRLHQLAAGDSLWLVTYTPNQQLKLVRRLVVHAKLTNPPGSRYGAYRVVGHPRVTLDFGEGLSIDTLIHYIRFMPHKPIPVGGVVPQYLQTIRELAADDSRLLLEFIQSYPQSSRLSAVAERPDL